MSQQNAPKWNFQADYLQACNCDYGCPCEFAAPPTMGHCDAAGVWRIRQGECGDIKLDGLCLGFVAHWPKAIHLGNGTVGLLIDERANPQQRETLINIAAGQFGGLPFEILATTFTTILDPVFAGFEVKLAGHQSSARVGDHLVFGFEPIKNPVTADLEFVRIEHKTGFIFKGAEVLSAREMEASVGSLNFSYPNKAAFVTEIEYHN